MKTDFETLKALALYTTDHLKEKGMIDFEIASREALIEEMATEFGVCFSTDEDIRDQAIEEVEDKMWCEYCPLWGLKETIEKDFLKILKKESTKEILDETLEILIIGEVIKIHEDERYKPIVKKFSKLKGS